MEAKEDILKAKADTLGLAIDTIREEHMKGTTPVGDTILKRITDILNNLRNEYFRQIDILIKEQRSANLLKLIEVLKTLEQSDEPEDYDKILKESTEISNLANASLIGDEGECLWENHGILARNGFAVFSLERDRFGWLVGGIQTSKGIITFG